MTGEAGPRSTRSETLSERRGWRWKSAPLPEAHVGLIVLGLLMNSLWPTRIATRNSLRGLGWLVVVAGVALATWATRAAGSVDLERPDRVITRGPYAVSRHPMYVGWTLVFVGVAFLLNTVWLPVLLPLLAASVHHETGREEDRLKTVFGSEYETYQARVRRYL